VLYEGFSSCQPHIDIQSRQASTYRSAGRRLHCCIALRMYIFTIYKELWFNNIL